MKVYISIDLAGVTGVYTFKQTRERDPQMHRDATRLLMGDIAAVAEGLRSAGVKEVLVLDAGRGDSFVAETMVPGVRYVSSWRRRTVFEGLDETCDGMVLLGYHAMNGTPDGVLHHTQSSRVEAKYWYDGVERGELYQHAVIAGHFGVPVMLVTGDAAVCREARATLGEDVPTVAVKVGISRESAILIGPEETREILTQGAGRAVAALPRLKPYKVSMPIQARVRRIGPVGGTHESPCYVEVEREIRDPLRIIRF